MLVAPLRFKSVLLDEMDRVINAAKLGRPASMILKTTPSRIGDIILKLGRSQLCGAPHRYDRARHLLCPRRGAR